MGKPSWILRLLCQSMASHAIVFEVAGASGAHPLVTTANGCYEFVGPTNEGRVKFQNSNNPDWTIDYVDGRWAICASESLRNKISDLPPVRVYINESDSRPLPPCTGWKQNWASQHLDDVRVCGYNKSLKRKEKMCVDLCERAWKERKFTDAEIVCNDIHFPVHRMVLCAVSVVFHAAFSSNMQEGKAASYEIRDSEPGIVEEMLRFLYTGDTNFSNSVLPSLLELAVQYDLEDLCECASEKLCQHVTVENVHERMLILKRHSVKECVKAARERLAELVRSDTGNELILALV